MRDAVVVGGGPAGSTTAALLVRAGFDVLLLEREGFPRDKPCGEFLTPGAARILRDIGVWPRLEAEGIRPLARAEIYPASGPPLVYTPTERPAGWSLRRSRLDAALLDLARESGAEVREGAAVRGLLQNRGKTEGVRLPGGAEIRAALVIGADGTRSLVARELGLVRPIPRLHRLALVSHWRGVEGQAIEMRARRGTVCGLGPLGDGEANLTLVVDRRENRAIAAGAEPFLRGRLESCFPDVFARLRQAERVGAVRTVGCFGHGCVSPCADGALLVGDAAAFRDPFTGEGVYFALRGAVLAARAASEALRAGDTSSFRLREYARARRELDSRYRLCDIVQGIVRRPPLLNRAVSALRANAPWRERLLETLGDLRDPRESLSPALLLTLLRG